MRFLCSHIMFGRTCTDGLCKDFHPNVRCEHGSNCAKGVFCSFDHTEAERMHFLIESRSRSTSPSFTEGDNSSVSSMSSTSVTADSTNSWCPMVSQRTNRTYYYNKKTGESTYNTSDVTLSLGEVDHLIKIDRENNARILADKDQKIRKLWTEVENLRTKVKSLEDENRSLVKKNAPKEKSRKQMNKEMMEQSIHDGDFYALGTKRPRNN